MSRASRRMRRGADRRAHRDGFYVEVPHAGDLSRWSSAAAATAVLDADERGVVSGIAHLVRRAILVDGASPGDSVWITYVDLGRAAR